MTLQETGKFLTVQDVLLRQHFRLKYFGTTISFLQVESQVAGLGELGVALGARVRLDTLVSHYMVPSIARFEEGTPAGKLPFKESNLQQISTLGSPSTYHYNSRLSSSHSATKGVIFMNSLVA